MTHNNVLKVNMHDKYYVYGFSLVDEKFIRVDKNDIIPLVPSLIDIIKSDKIKMMVTENILRKTNKKIRTNHVAQAMGISTRTLHRMMIRDDIFVSDEELLKVRKKPMKINIIN